MGIVLPDKGFFAASFAPSTLRVAREKRAPESFTFLMASMVCLYAWISARQAPEIERIAERTNIAND